MLSLFVFSMVSPPPLKAANDGILKHWIAPQKAVVSVNVVTVASDLNITSDQPFDVGIKPEDNVSTITNITPTSFQAIYHRTPRLYNPNFVTSLYCPSAVGWKIA